jgi:hypothetical protein
MIRAPIRPRTTTPPTTPPTIAAILVLEPPLLLPELLPVTLAGEVDLVVDPVGGREDSAPFVFWARVTLNEFETYDDILGIASKSRIVPSYGDVLIGISWHLGSNGNLLGVAR